ncbi:MAG TPA: GGDEF domain-containing protein [Methylophilaceae bacterium]|jgi:diguanylate cyclase
MNKQVASPIEIARQTLMQLAQRKILPTPDNFRIAYDEISGQKSDDQSKIVGKTLEKVLLDAAKSSPKYISAAQTISPLIEKKDWIKLEEQFRKLFPGGTGASNGSEVNWSIVIRSLLKQLELNHKGMTLSRKKEGLSRVLSNFANDSDALGQKIQALIGSWGQEAEGLGIVEVPQQIAEPVHEQAKQTQLSSHVVNQNNQAPGNALEQTKLVALWRDMLLKVFEMVIIPVFDSQPDTQQKAQALLDRLRKTHSESGLLQHSQDLKAFMLKIELQRDSEKQIHSSLMTLLRLMTTSISELVVEDKWVTGQLAILQDLMNKPLNISTLYDAESSIKDLIYKQSNLKPVLIDTKDRLKKMAETFVDRLVEMTESTSDYQVKIEGYQQRIRATEDVGELNQIVEGLLADTKVIGINVQRSRDEFALSQKKVVESEKKIQELIAELDHISEVAHEDYLTGALNRRGMDEALSREFNRADRYNTAISIAMMDIDHFKKLNDSLGHSTGDHALAHFAKVIKEVMRSTDVLARYGGEEFIIILPATEQAEAIDVVTRVQRELTKNIFLNKNEKVLITFSAGVAERMTGESPDQIIPRADAALYQAKQTGRNRVVGAVNEIEGTL